MNGRAFASWSKPSSELFFWQDATMLVSRVSIAGDFQQSTPVPAFGRGVSGWNGTTARELNIVVGWDAVVRAKGTPK